MILKPRLFRKPRKGHWATKGLVCFPLMNEGSGNKVFDISGNRNTGVFRNIGGTAPSWTSGKFGSAILLPGDDEYISVDDSDSLNGKRTVIIWFKPLGGFSSGGGSETIISHRTTDGETEGFFAFLQTLSGEIRSSNDPGAAANVTLDSVQSSWNEEWYMLAVTADGTNMTMYINGVYENSTAFTTAFTDATNTLHFGANRSGGANFTGWLDLPMIYNRPLPAWQIAELAYNPFCMFERDSIELWVGATSVGVAPEVANPKGPLGHPLCGALAGPISF